MLGDSFPTQRSRDLRGPIFRRETGAGQRVLRRVWNPACTFLGSRTAIVGGAMSHVSGAQLVSALSEAGGFGILAAGGRRPESIEAEIKATRVRTDRPFGVNVITLDPRITRQLEVCVDAKVTHIVLGGGVPGAAQIALAKRNGAKVMCFAPSLPIGERLLRLGADALIIEGHEAGGHVGPVSTTALAQEMLPLMRRGALVFAAGGIGTGQAVASYLAMGAAGCQLGTRFVCAHESPAHPAMKAAFIRAAARDAVLSHQLNPRLRIIPVRALANKATEEFASQQRALSDLHSKGELSNRELLTQLEIFWSGRLRRAVNAGDIEHGSLMSGQSVGLISCEESVEEIICALTEEASAAISRLSF